MSRFGLLFCFPSTVDSSVALLRRFARQRRFREEAGARDNTANYLNRRQLIQFWDILDSVCFFSSTSLLYIHHLAYRKITQALTNGSYTSRWLHELAKLLSQSPIRKPRALPISTISLLISSCVPSSTVCTEFFLSLLGGWNISWMGSICQVNLCTSKC